jgi:hypothetical protein
MFPSLWTKEDPSLETLLFFRLFKKNNQQPMDEVQNKKSCNIMPSPNIKKIIGGWMRSKADRNLMTKRKIPSP